MEQKIQAEKINRTLNCISCPKTVKVARYQLKSEADYKCAECRGNATKSPKKKRT